MAELTQEDLDFQSFMNTGVYGDNAPIFPGTPAGWEDPTTAVGSAMASLDAPQPVNDSPVPDELLAQDQPSTFDPNQAAPTDQGWGLTNMPQQPEAPPPAPPGSHLAGASYSAGGTYHTLPTPQPGKAPAPIDPNAEFGVRTAGLQEKYNALGEARDAELATNDVEEAGLNDEVQLRREQATEQNIQIARDRQAQQAAQQAVLAAQAEVKAIDPTHVWSTKSAGQQAAALVSAFIGGFLSPYNGGKNSALEQINAMIDQDIQAQEQNQANARYMLGRADTKLENATSQLDRSRQIRKAAALEDIAKQTAAKAAQFKSKFTQAKYAEQVGNLQNEAGKIYADIGKRVYDEQTASYRFEEEMKQKRWAESQANWRQSQMIKYQKDRDDKDRAAKEVDPLSTMPLTLNSAMTGKRYVMDPARAGTVKNPQLSTDARSKLDERWQKNADMAQRIKALLDSPEGAKYRGWFSTNRVFDSDKDVDLRGAYADFKSAIIKERFGATLSDGEQALANDLLGSLESWTKVGFKTRLRTMMGDIGHAQEALAKSYGLVDEEGRQYNAKEDGFDLPDTGEIKSQTLTEVTQDLRSLKNNPGVASEETWNGAAKAARDRGPQIAKSNPGAAVEYLGALYQAAKAAPKGKAREDLLVAAAEVEATLRRIETTNNALATPAPSSPFGTLGPNGEFDTSGLGLARRRAAGLADEGPDVFGNEYFFNPTDRGGMSVDDIIRRAKNQRGAPKSSGGDE